MTKFEDPRFEAVSKALLHAKWQSLPVSNELAVDFVTESLAPAVLPVIDRCVAAKLREVADQWFRDALSTHDPNEAREWERVAAVLRAEADRLEPGQGEREERS